MRVAMHYSICHATDADEGGPLTLVMQPVQMRGRTQYNYSFNL